MKRFFLLLNLKEQQKSGTDRRLQFLNPFLHDSFVFVEKFFSYVFLSENKGYDAFSQTCLPLDLFSGFSTLYQI